MRQDVIVLGGGVAGLTCARELHRAGRGVLLLERARGVGGRLATRRYLDQPIDFGPIFLHGRDPSFLEAVRETEGAVFPTGWPSRVGGNGQPCQPSAFEDEERRAILPGGLNGFAKHLARDLPIRLQTCVKRIVPEAEGFVLESEGGEDFRCRDLVVALALEETRALLATLPEQPESTALQALLGLFASVSSLTVLAAYPLDVAAPDWDILYPEHSPCLQLVAQDSRKRPHPRFLTLVIQARPAWSAERMEAPEADWSRELLERAAEQVGDWALHPLWASPHRWRFARVDRGNELVRPLLVPFPSHHRLGLAGDVFAPGGGVQAAFLSGSALAQRLLNEVSP